MSFELLVAAALLYSLSLFAVAWGADRMARRGKLAWVRHPAIYTLSLSVFCSAWTFYGAVGYASRSGLEFATIYLGPTIVFTASWWALRRLIRVARLHNVTSIADLISARFGKSNTLAALITGLVLVASTPYIAVQLQSVALSFAIFSNGVEFLPGPFSLWVALGLALFAILFGTRNLSADDRHHGVVMAIALEGVVKLVAFVVLGCWVVWGLGDGPAAVLAQINAYAAGPEGAGWQIEPLRFNVLLVVAGMSIVTLPRMFQVMVVEATDERQMRSAGWAFPAYLLAMSLFVLPVAVIGQERLPEANPDLYMLALPLAEGKPGLALLTFLGGFSSASAMVVVSALALSTMISNHWIMPLGLRLRQSRGASDPVDLGAQLRGARRVAILAIIIAGEVYYLASGGGASLAAMGTVAFTGVAQIFPAMLVGLLWRRATRPAAISAIISGATIWIIWIFLPSLGLRQGLPETWGDPMAMAVLISLGVNLLTLLGVSLATIPSPQERLQALSFVHALAPDPRSGLGVASPPGELAETLLNLSTRIWGAEPALAFFAQAAQAQGRRGYLPEADGRFLAELERRLAGAVGTATAHAMLVRATGQRAVTFDDLLAVAGEAQQSLARSARLEDEGAELARTARQLRDANARLTALSEQKDSFLSQISHELRTPLTSIRAFSEFLSEPDLPDPQRREFAGIIHDEASRLTRLLDDLLDLSVLESGRVAPRVRIANLHDLIERALQSASAVRPERSFLIDRDLPAEQCAIYSDPDRILQVLINIIANARKYCDSDRPELKIRVVQSASERVILDIVDNGSGVAPADQPMLFEKFARLTTAERAGSAGLGLAISREIMHSLGGSLDYLPGQGGAAFRLVLPVKIMRQTKNLAQNQGS